LVSFCPDLGGVCAWPLCRLGLPWPWSSTILQRRGWQAQAGWCGVQAPYLIEMTVAAYILFFAPVVQAGLAAAAEAPLRSPSYLPVQSPGRRCVVVPVRWCAGAPVRRCAGALVRWCAGAVARWFCAVTLPTLLTSHCLPRNIPPGRMQRRARRSHLGTWWGAPSSLLRMRFLRAGAGGGVVCVSVLCVGVCEWAAWLLRC